MVPNKTNFVMVVKLLTQLTALLYVCKTKKYLPTDSRE